MASFKNRTKQANIRNEISFVKYKDMLDSMAIICAEWVNLPQEIDIDRVELMLHTRGSVAFFRDEVLGQYMMLPFNLVGELTIYNTPTKIEVYANNGYHRYLEPSEYVPVYNNSLRQPTEPTVIDYAERLARFERTIDVNVAGQRTPLIILCDERQRLTMQNMIEQYDSNTPFIFGTDLLDLETVKVLPTQVPFITPQLQGVKTALFNECLTYLGVPNTPFQKKERLTLNESVQGMGGVIASQFTRIEPRQKAVAKINELFGLDIEVKYRNLKMDEGEGEEDGELYNETSDIMRISSRL